MASKKQLVEKAKKSEKVQKVKKDVKIKKEEKKPAAVSKPVVKATKPAKKQQRVEVTKVVKEEKKEEKPSTTPTVSGSATNKTKPSAAGKRGYVYIGHLPHGFYEDEVRGYFTQFGKVLKVRLSRSKKTGSHRGFGFVEFQNDEVAKIAAETMNNYLMFNKVLKCHVIPSDQVHKEMFRNANKSFTLPKKSDFRKKFNAKKSDAQLLVNKFFF